MKKFTSFALAALLATSGTAVFAASENASDQQTGPVAMTDAQMDSVSAGLVNVGIVLVDVADINNVANNNLNNNDVAIGIPINAAVAVLGRATAIQLPSAPRLGRQ